MGQRCYLCFLVRVFVYIQIRRFYAFLIHTYFGFLQVELSDVLLAFLPSCSLFQYIRAYIRFFLAFDFATLLCCKAFGIRIRGIEQDLASFPSLPFFSAFGSFPRSCNLHSSSNSNYAYTLKFFIVHSLVGTMYIRMTVLRSSSKYG